MLIAETFAGTAECWKINIAEQKNVDDKLAWIELVRQNHRYFRVNEHAYWACKIDHAGEVKADKIVEVAIFYIFRRERDLNSAPAPSKLSAEDLLKFLEQKGEKGCWLIHT